MKKSLSPLVIAGVLFACGEAEIDSAIPNIPAEEANVSVTLNNVPDQEIGNPVYVFTKTSQDLIYAVVGGIAEEDATISIAPPPGTGSFTLVSYIPNDPEWTIDDGLVAGFYSSVTGVTDRNARYVTNDWESADSFDDSSQDNASLTLGLTLSVSDNEVDRGDIISITASIDNNLNVDITSVVFSIDGTAITTINESPYSINYNTIDLEEGEYTLSALVTTEDGDTGEDDLEITIFEEDANSAPTVSITSIENGDTFERQDLVEIVASVTDPNGSDDISSVSFVINGSTVATLTESPFSYDWDTFDNQVGDVSIEVTATDISGAERSDFVNVTLISPDDFFPRATLTSPANGSSFAAGTSSITLNTTASDPDGDDIEEVSWSYVDGIFTTVIGSDDTAPYSFNWDPSALAPGEYTIITQATSEDGITNDPISVDRITITITE